MYREIIGQIIGLIAPIMTVISYQLNTKKKVLFALSAATLATCISYLLLGATVGFALNIVCLIRNICCFFFIKSKRDVLIWFGIFATVMGACSIFTYEGLYSLLSIFGLIINSYFVLRGEPQSLRKSILLTSTMVLIYNIIVFSFGGIANELMALVSAAIGIIRYRKGSGEA